MDLIEEVPACPSVLGAGRCGVRGGEDLGLKWIVLWSQTVVKPSSSAPSS